MDINYLNGEIRVFHFQVWQILAIHCTLQGSNRLSIKWNCMMTGNNLAQQHFIQAFWPLLSSVMPQSHSII